MSTDLAIEGGAFNDFIIERFSLQHSEATLEEALAAFRAYQRDLERLKEKLRPSIEEADRGGAKLLDLNAVLNRVRQRFDEQRAL